MTSPNAKASNWKQFLLNSPPTKYIPFVLKKIKYAGGPQSNAEKIFSDLSRNPSVALLALVALDQLVLLHSPTLLGGSWLDKELKTVTLTGFGKRAIPIHVIPKSIKDVKTKAPKIADISHAIDNGQNLSTIKSITKNFIYKNAIPIPDFLIKSFVLTDPPSPENIAIAFYNTLKFIENNEDSDYDTEQEDPTDDTLDQANHPTSTNHGETPLTSSKTTKEKKSNTQKLLPTFKHVLQFCYLCQKDKIPPINYTINIYEEISTWHNRLEQSIMSPDPPLPTTVIGPTTDHSLQDDEETNASSIHSLEKDTHIVNTLLKNSEQWIKTHLEQLKKRRIKTQASRN